MPHDDAHFSVTLPSDLIAEVMEGHFNKSMFKKRVRVVDLRMEQDMCMFSLAWIDAPRVEGTETDEEFAVRIGVPIHEDISLNEEALRRSGLAAQVVEGVDDEMRKLFSPAPTNGRDTRGRFRKRGE
jgi:hypothetical protein